MVKRIFSRAGNPTNYVGYVIPVFLLYLLYNIYLYPTSSPLPPAVQPFLGWAYSLILNPLILAGLYGAIYEQQRTNGETGIGELLAKALRYFWHIAGANIFYLVFSLALTIAFSIALHNRQSEQIQAYVDIPLSAVTLFWFACLMGEGGLFSSLRRAVAILARNPLALALGILWGVFRFADSTVLKTLVAPGSLVWSGGDAAVTAALRVLVTVYAVALYRDLRGEALEAQQATAPIPDASQPAASQTLINASIGFAFLAFLPLVHLVALILGILAIRRNRQFSMRSAIAICTGGFFTIFYALLLAGWLLTLGTPSNDPGYKFLSQTNPALVQQVALLEQNSYSTAQQDLEPMSKVSPKSDWTVNCALALAQQHNDDLDGALQSFYLASEQNPDRSEFYYYYGLALLDKGEGQMAADQFRSAGGHNPALPQAAGYASLSRAAFTPPQLVTISFTVIILLILFTVHEYGHAYAAWKLGDDTGKRLGRLTLNPISHLDLFGSILLPGILLFQQSGIVVGWAKPVPVNPANFKNPRRDHMRVSFAGPAVNIVVAMVCFLILGGLALALKLLWPQTLTWNFAEPFSSMAIVGPPFSQQLTVIVIFLKQLMYTSLVLGFFNLLPIPPLDGSWILAGILPEGLRNAYSRLRLFGVMIFLALVLTHVLDYYTSIPVIASGIGLHLLISAAGLG